MGTVITSKRSLAGGVAGAVALGGLFVSVGPASASVARNQVTTLQYQVTVADQYVHSYTVTPDPCGPDFTGTGQYPAAPASATYDETLSGTVGGPVGPGTSLTYTDYYLDPSSGQPTGYQYTFTGAFTDAAGDFAGTITDNRGNSNLPTTGKFLSASSTSYNHGQYVSQNGPSAAHSCVGMPAQSHG